jgi:DNA-binding MarR family transcriptional regulator
MASAADRGVDVVADPVFGELLETTLRFVRAHATLSSIRAYTHYFSGNENAMTARNEIPMALRAAYHALHRRSEARFAQHGATADQFVLLATLARGHAVTQRELARRMPSDPSTVRAMLVLLERSGLVQREPHPSDARARTVSLTTAGKRKFRQLWAAGESIREEMFGALQPHEADTLVRLLTQLADALNAEGVPVGGSDAIQPSEDGT